MATRWEITKAVRASDMPSPARLLMFVLADVADVGTAEIPQQFTPSVTVLERETGLGRSTVKRYLAALEEQGWITRTRPDAAGMWHGERVRYRLTAPDGLGPQETPGEPAETPPRVHSEPRVGPQEDRGGSTVNLLESDHSDHSSDQNLSSVTRHRPDVEKICRHLADKIADNGSKRPKITERWRTEARLLLDRDGRTVQQVINAIDWCQADPFWRSNVLSMPKLREKYDQLRLAAKRNGGARASPGLVERDGLKLKPETAQRLADRAKWEAIDAANQRNAIEGPT